ncbi:DUF6955 family protein [Archaeoglobus profundus]|uniref:Uncharacterized protein n=1 Tax=Archaeoglobus profundus (strain DSM 5631 / JCM 9629 / NBRC 100127 / Av18) TaxID=572546 RepID=D2RDX1_ARCPA|nr:hypothetical protein [Archaeoglobus profundus]ADB58315.1 hypothetical protein Arcpr_1263 [Archaeoglobus profundus DSM 5631]
MVHYIGIILDDKRYEQIKGTPLEEKIQYIFGGALKMLVVEVPEDKSQQILKAFDRARIDSRGFIEDLPVAFKRALFEEIAKAKSLDVIDKVLERLPEIQELAKKEEEYIPPPEIE